MHMRIVWGKILPGRWDAFEAAFKKALEICGEPKGLKSQWLLRDQNDPDAGYSISHWESGEDMRAFWDSKKRSDAMAVIQPFFREPVHDHQLRNSGGCKPLSRGRKAGDDVGTTVPTLILLRLAADGPPVPNLLARRTLIPQLRQPRCCCPS
jgi:heme-degrading monooxygenase HmoA